MKSMFAVIFCVVLPLASVFFYNDRPIGPVSYTKPVVLGDLIEFEDCRIDAEGTRFDSACVESNHARAEALVSDPGFVAEREWVKAPASPRSEQIIYYLAPMAVALLTLMAALISNSILAALSVLCVYMVLASTGLVSIVYAVVGSSGAMIYLAISLIRNLSVRDL